MREYILANLDIDFVINFLFKEALMFVASGMFILGAVLIDLRTGIAKARALKDKVHSKSLRKSIVKFKEYVSVLYFGCVLDLCVGLVYKPFPIGVAIIGLAVCCIEFYSVIENLKAKKSSAGKTLDILQKIIETSSKEDALEVIEKIKSLKQ